MAPLENSKAQYLLVKTKDNCLYIITWSQLIMHREKTKLKIGVEISWTGKNRKERGRGTLVAIGKFTEQSFF